MSSLPELFELVAFKLHPVADVDAERLAGFLAGFVNDAYSEQNRITGVPRTDAEEVARDMTAGGLYMVRRGQEVVGTVHVRYEEGVVHLGMLAVSEKLQRKGLGRALITATCAYAESLAAESIELSFLEQVGWLEGYYEQFGFLRTGEVSEPQQGIRLVHMINMLEESRRR